MPGVNIKGRFIQGQTYRRNDVIIPVSVGFKIQYSVNYGRGFFF
jgi:hypothetical protein